MVICDTFWGFVIQKIIGEDDSNLTNMFEKMLKPQTIVLGCEFFKETRFISDRSLQMKDLLNGRHGGLGRRQENPQSNLLCPMHVPCMRRFKTLLQNTCAPFWRAGGMTRATPFWPLHSPTRKVRNCGSLLGHPYPEAWMLQAEGPYSTETWRYSNRNSNIASGGNWVTGPEWPDILRKAVAVGEQKAIDTSLVQKMVEQVQAYDDDWEEPENDYGW